MPQKNPVHPEELLHALEHDSLHVPVHPIQLPIQAPVHPSLLLSHDIEESEQLSNTTI